MFVCKGKIKYCAPERCIYFQFSWFQFESEFYLLDTNTEKECICSLVWHTEILHTDKKRWVVTLIHCVVLHTVMFLKGLWLPCFEMLCVISLVLCSRETPARHNAFQLFWISSMADIVPLCPCFWSFVFYLQHSLHLILHYPDPPGGICAQRARSQS